MLMAKFGKFKLRLMAAIHMSALLAIFNVASTTSNYWLKYIEPETTETHFAGLWRSCPNQGVCMWKDGIVGRTHTIWSYLVRIFITIGTFGNIFVVLIFFMAFIYKLNKKTRCVVRLLEVGNVFLLFSFGFVMAGFCMFISNKCNYSLWLHCISMVFVFFASNLLTRYFASFYFINCRAASKGGLIQSNESTQHKVDDEDAINDEEKIALAPISKDTVTTTEVTVGMIKPTITTTTTTTTTSETHGSNEALITQPVTIIDCTPTATEPATA
jgi:hypothetical protein